MEGGMIAMPLLLQWVSLFFFGLLIPSLGIVLVFKSRSYGRNRAQEVIHVYKLEDTAFGKLHQTRPQRENVLTFTLPILLLAAAALSFAALLTDYQDVFSKGFKQPYPILCGPKCEDAAKLADYQARTVVIACYAFLGWFAWSLVTLFERWRSYQVFSATFFRLLTRMAVAVIAAVVIRHGYSLFFPADSEIYLVVVAFCCGLVPEAAMSSIVRGLQKLQFLQQTQVPPEPLELTQIEGITPSLRFRLNELGIENAEGMAKVNPVSLTEYTGLPLAETVDWVGQAQLLLLLKPDAYRILQSHGIRRIADFIKCVESETDRRMLGSLMRLDDDLLRMGVANVRRSAEYRNLLELLNRLEAGPPGEPHAAAEPLAEAPPAPPPAAKAARAVKPQEVAQE